jgi:putative transcriptional regulator
MNFSKRLKELRKKANLTQVEVAEKLGISQPAYASWERGVKKPTQENLVKIAKLFNASIDTLVSNDKTDGIDLSEVELLFRTTSDGMSNEEKEVFKQELLQFMKERKKLFEGGNNE